jgi:hypothetical protein
LKRGYEIDVLVCQPSIVLLDLGELPVAQLVLALLALRVAARSRDEAALGLTIGELLRG